jgi:hypothetical protein
VVERARLESECTVLSRTEGSNPSLSARYEKARLARAFSYLVKSLGLEHRAAKGSTRSRISHSNGPLYHATGYRLKIRNAPSSSKIITSSVHLQSFSESQSLYS